MVRAVGVIMQVGRLEDRDLVRIRVPFVRSESNGQCERHQDGSKGGLPSKTHVGLRELSAGIRIVTRARSLARTKQGAQPLRQRLWIW